MNYKNKMERLKGSNDVQISASLITFSFFIHCSKVRVIETALGPALYVKKKI